MTSQPLHSWHQIPYIWQHVQGLWHLVPYICDITDTMFVNTYQQYFSSNTWCRGNTTTISEITTSICVSVWSHTVYLWHNTHCIDNMAPTIFMAQYALYMTSNTRFMTSQLSNHYISLLYLISNWLYLVANTLYLYHHTQIIDNITPIVYMITQAQYVDIIWIHMTSHPLFMISHNGMTFTHTVSCRHTQDTCHHIHCSWAITYSVLSIPHLQYVWFQTHYIYGITWILCDIATTH